MTHRPLTIILITVLAIPFFIACRHGQIGGGADTDSVNWDDSIDHICNKTYRYFNNYQIDSLELLVPEAMQLCLEHGKMRQYYDVWSTVTELYIANEDFEKGAAEARLMQEDALKRHNAFGLSVSYKMLGLGYAFSETADADSFHQLEAQADERMYANKQQLHILASDGSGAV